MAERRMFAKTIIDSDAFLDMPVSAQLLYFHLSMRADDDGFINSPKSIMRLCGAKDDDLKLLFVKKFVIPFESGVVVIKHWKIHNYIRTDRYKETTYQREKSQLSVSENGSYTLGIPSDNQMDTVGIPSDNQMDTQVRLGKDSLGKVSEGKVRKGKKESGDAFSEFASGNDDLLKTLRDFEKMRKEIDKPMSDRAKSMLLTKLQTFPRSEWIPILEQSIFHDWQGIFPLKDNAPTPPRGQPQASRGASALDALRNLHAQYEDEE